jgi:hypothetical protein
LRICVQLAGLVAASAQRKLVVCNSALGYHGGVLAAAAAISARSQRAASGAGTRVK